MLNKALNGHFRASKHTFKRKAREPKGSHHLRKAQVPYNSDFTPENSGLSAKNTYFWRDNP